MARISITYDSPDESVVGADYASRYGVGHLDSLVTKALRDHGASLQAEQIQTLFDRAVNDPAIKGVLDTLVAGGTVQKSDKNLTVTAA